MLGGGAELTVHPLVVNTQADQSDGVMLCLDVHLSTKALCRTYYVEDSQADKGRCLHCFAVLQDNHNYYLSHINTWLFCGSLV